MDHDTNAMNGGASKLKRRVRKNDIFKKAWRHRRFNIWEWGYRNAPIFVKSRGTRHDPPGGTGDPSDMAGGSDFDKMEDDQVDDFRVPSRWRAVERRGMLNEIAAAHHENSTLMRARLHGGCSARAFAKTHPWEVFRRRVERAASGLSFVPDRDPVEHLLRREDADLWCDEEREASSSTFKSIRRARRMGLFLRPGQRAKTVGGQILPSGRLLPDLRIDPRVQERSSVGVTRVRPGALQSPYEGHIDHMSHRILANRYEGAVGRQCDVLVGSSKIGRREEMLESSGIRDRGRELQRHMQGSRGSTLQWVYEHHRDMYLAASTEEAAIFDRRAREFADVDARLREVERQVELRKSEAVDSERLHHALCEEMGGLLKERSPQRSLPALMLNLIGNPIGICR